MKIGIFLTAAAAAAAIIGGALPARACVFDSRDVQRDIDKAEVVFSGGVTAVRHIPNGNNQNYPEYRATFHVDKVFKGRTGGDPVDVVQLYDTWSRYTYFDVGKKYLVLASHNQYGLRVNGCSPVMSLDPASASGDEPGMEYKFSMAAALGEGSLFPVPAAAPVNGARKRLEQENDQQNDQQNGQDSGGGGN